MSNLFPIWPTFGETDPERWTFPTVAEGLIQNGKEL
jgi:hypothetical protein